MEGCQFPLQQGQTPHDYDSLRTCHFRNLDTLKNRQSVKFVVGQLMLTGSREMMERSPVPSITDLHRWEVDRVKIHIVLSHELIEVNVLRIEPPLFPLGREICGNADVAYWGIKLKGISNTLSFRIKAAHPNI